MEVTVRELLAPSLYGDLEPLMNDTRSVQLTHVAEAMIPTQRLSSNGTPELWVRDPGCDCLGRNPTTQRQSKFLYRDFRGGLPRGRPSTWSGALDQAAAGSMPG